VTILQGGDTWPGHGDDHREDELVTRRPILQVIIGSTRPGRAGAEIARWFTGVGESHGRFGIELVDLLDVALPLLDEPEHPASGVYLREHTMRWSATVSRGDAYVFVLPEYNHSMNAATKNAFDYLHREWKHKAVGFVSYGGVAAGTRAVQAARGVATSLSMVPVYEGVNIPFFRQFLDHDGVFAPDERIQESARSLLDSLAHWDTGLRVLRS
jgi:NAD(P)H-dependent FMN reductase